MLYRLFPHDPEAGHLEPGGALHAPRALQGRGRHDNPDRYGVLYASRSQASVVAEFLWGRGIRHLTARDLVSETRHAYAVARLDDAALEVLDLDDPRNLLRRELRPSTVATRSRKVTRRWAGTIYEEGVAGFAWWSTIEASWINVTLFADRVSPSLRLVDQPQPLDLEHPALREAADLVGVTLA